MSTDLYTEFASARLDEDDRGAQLAHGETWSPAGSSVESSTGWVFLDDLNVGYAAYAAHAARHDPARVLAQTAVLRRLLDEHPAVARTLADMWPDHPDHPGRQKS